MTPARQRPKFGDVRPPITWRDVAAGALAGLALCALMSVALHPDPVSALGYVMSAISGGSFALARRYPLATLAITTYAIVFYTAADEPGGPIYVAVFVAAMNLAARAEHTRGWLPWVGATGFLLLVAEAIAGEFQWHFLPVVALLVVLPKIVADRARARALHTRALEARVESAAHEAQRHMAEERLQ